MGKRLVAALLTLTWAGCSSPTPGKAPTGDPVEAGAGDASDASTVCSPQLALVDIVRHCKVSTAPAVGLCITGGYDAGAAAQTVCLFSPADTWFVAQLGERAMVSGSGWQFGPTSYASAQVVAPLSATDETACEALLASLHGAVPELCSATDATTGD